jgi:hypothetical protein
MCKICPLSQYRAGSIDAQDDVIQVWIPNPDVLTDTFKTDELLPIRNLILGNVSDRTPDRPGFNEDGVLVGGTAFERSEHRTHPVKPGARCYQYLGLSTQKPPNVTSPSVNSKLPTDDDRDLRERMLKVRNLTT